MRTRSTSIVLLCGSFLLLSAGCRKPALVRAPTRVVAEEPEPAVVAAVRAGSEEQESPAPPKDLLPATEAVAFHFPADRGGELLSKELTPARPLPEPAAEPRRDRRAAQPEHAGIAAAAEPGRVRRVAAWERLQAAATALAKQLPGELVALALETALPEAQPMAVGDRTKEPGANVNKPAPLPILGQPVPDRASLADATGEGSGAAVIAAKMPIRQRPVPFQRLGVPDPFENYRSLRLPLPGEPTDPVAASPRLPK